jgi:hypothetical protein
MATRRRTRGRDAQLAFDALAIVGGLLSPEWLSKIAQLAAGGQSEADYDIPRGLNLRDELGRYWRVAQAHWADFEAGRDGKADPAALSTRFVTALLRDVLGFTTLTAAPPAMIDERSYPIGHVALDGRVPIVIAPPAERGLESPSSTFGDGGRKRSPFGLVQEHLNAQDGALWGLCSDGLTLRIVRDNASLTRPAWIEADLARIFAEARYADFTALWLLCHQSRFGRPTQPGDAAPPATGCALERWRDAGREQGTRARDKLRRGVEEALLALGRGFLAHPDNHALRAELQRGALTVDGYHSQLLRLVYRLIFVLTAEERGLIHGDEADPDARALYAEGYSLRRLRDRALRRSAHDRHADLWEATKIVWRGLATGEPRLGLPPLAGLFAAGQCAALDAASLPNHALMLAMFRLAWLRDEGSLTRVNWRDMGPEELGSVYESLLELVPQVTDDARDFRFAGETRGHARKTTGSYYTPDSLVQVLLDSALDPVVRETIARHPANPVDALLGLAIVDPACGSGHFLLAAARRVAAHVARLRVNGTPSEPEYRQALREVVSHCIFGVDLNALAVELCKVGLWMEAMDPRLPLTFLDSHVQHGNALLGATPELMARGIPDAAWEPLEGDHKKTASALKKRNKAERVDTNAVFEFSRALEGGTVAIRSQVQLLDAAPDTSVAEVERKQSTWAALLESVQYRGYELAADAWCAAFVWRKPLMEPDPTRPSAIVDPDLARIAPTHDVWQRLRHDPELAEPRLIDEVQRLAKDYRFFHWHLRFPQVFARGGFDVVLGNPPWERVKLQEQEFFAAKSDEIANAANAAARKKLIAQLPLHDATLPLWNEWIAASRRAEGESHVIRNTGRYPLCGKGDVNTYAIFAEHNRAILGPRGRAGFIVPTGIATDDTTKEYFGTLVNERQLARFYSFENEEFVFPGVHHAFRFALLTVTRDGSATAADLVFFARQVAALDDPDRHFTLSPEDFETLNPNTRTCPTFRSKRDASINLAMYRRAGVLWREDDADGNPWGLRFMAMLHMANDSGLFRTRAELEAAGWKREGSQFVRDTGRMLPLVEAKMAHQYDHRFGTYEGQSAGQANQGKLPELDDAAHADPNRLTMPNYWVGASEVAERIDERWARGWLLGWRDICRSTDQRTVIASLIPRSGTGDTFLLALPGVEPGLVGALYASLCSIALDYAARQKVGGTHIKYHTFKQLPVLRPSIYATDAAWQRGTTLRDWILPRVLELTYTAWDLQPFAHDVGHDGPPFRWDAARRFQVRCELDAAFFHLYGIARADVDYILDTFPIVRKNDEKKHGEYRTKRTILEIHDALARAAATGVPYVSPLPPPRTA